MIDSTPRFTGAVWLSVLLAVMLNSLPLSNIWPAWPVWRPDWVVLALIHWALLIRQDTSLIMAFFIGLLTDALSHSLLGQHAFGYVLVTYFAVRLGLRMTAEAFLQQMALIFIVGGVFMLLNLWINGVVGGSGVNWMYWAPLVSSLAIWPVFHGLYGYFLVQRKAI